jgi:hypothetical protein
MKRVSRALAILIAAAAQVWSASCGVDGLAGGKMGRKARSFLRLRRFAPTNDRNQIGTGDRLRPE